MNGAERTPPQAGVEGGRLDALSRPSDPVGPVEPAAVVKVIGVGGGGGNALDGMVRLGVGGVEFAALNTDAQALASSSAPVRLPIGGRLTRGLGAGSDPEIGRQAAETTGASSRRCAETPRWWC